MKDKLKKANYIQLGLWIVAIIGLLLLILIPKLESTVINLFAYFIILYVVLPIILSLTKIVITYYYKYKDEFGFAIMPFVGSAIIMPMVLIYFIGSLNVQGKLIIIITASIIFIYNIIAMLFTFKKKDQFKLYLTLLVISLLLYIANIYIAINVSYYYSVNW